MGDSAAVSDLPSHSDGGGGGEANGDGAGNGGADAASPGPIIELMQAYKLAAAAAAAVETGLFDALAAAERADASCAGTGASHASTDTRRAGATAAAIAERAGLPPRATGILLEALVLPGLVECWKAAGDVYYRLTAASRRYLVSTSPDCLADYVYLTCHPRVWQGFGRLSEVVRHDGTVLDAHAEVPENDYWTVFARVTAKNAAANAAAFASGILPHLPRATDPRILDVACGSGWFGGALARAARAGGHGQPRVTFFDQRNVLATTRERAVRLELGDAAFLEGGVFDVAWGGPYDVVILSNLYHLFAADRCRALTERAARALAPGGIAVVQDFMTDPGSAAHDARLAAVFSLTMLVWTRGGQAYGVADYDGFFGGAGLARISPPADASDEEQARGILVYRHD